MALSNKIEFTFQVPVFELNQRKIIRWIQAIIKEHNKKLELVHFIFCSDATLLKLNKKFLKHDYYTDIITFPYQEQFIEADIFISSERVLKNAKKYKVEFEVEILRVMIHGIFHLLGYKDKTNHDKETMRALEDKAILLYHNELIKENHYFDQVYDIVRCIPKGRVSTYGAISNFLNLGSARMTGWALNQLKGRQGDVPAHRVVNASGELTGRHAFINDKDMEKLLKKEGTLVKENKVIDFTSKFWNPSLEL